MFAARINYMSQYKLVKFSQNNRKITCLYFTFSILSRIVMKIVYYFETSVSVNRRVIL